MAIIGTLPNIIANGQAIDAVPVMADFNWIVSQVNANAAQLAGGNTFTGPQLGVAAAVATAFPIASQIQNNAFNWCGTATGTNNALALTPAIAAASYSAGQTFIFKAGATSNSGATTVAVSGLTTLAVQVSGVACIGGEIAANLFYGLLVDASGTSAQLYKLSVPSTLGTAQVQPITASVAASALTATLNPTSLDFRSTTIGSGTVTTLAVPAAISVVIPATATLGTISATAGTIIVLAINNAGTVELALINASGAPLLTETGLISTVALTTASNSTGVFYSTTARTNVAYRVVGYLTSTQSTAGTWATAPSTIQGAGGNAVVNLAVASSSSAITVLAQQSTNTKTVIDFTVPANPKRINVMFDSVTGGSTGPIIVQIGVVGTPETTSYNSASSTNGGSLGSTAGFILSFRGTSSGTFFGDMTMSLMDAATNSYTMKSGSTYDNANGVVSGGGKKCAAAVTLVRVTTTTAAAFTGGNVGCSYEI